MIKIMKVVVVSTLVFAMTATLSACTPSNNSNKVSSESEVKDEGFTTVEEVNSFIDSVYATLPEESIPGMINNQVLALTDTDTIAYNTGLTDLAGITDIVVSESLIGSHAYSLVYITTEVGADVEAIKSNLLNNINPAKWICVSADKIIVNNFGSDIILVMAQEDRTETVYNAAEVKAKETFTVIGEKTIK